MKKLLSLIAVVVLGASTTFAQTVVPVSKQTAKKVAEVKTETKKLETKAVAAKTTAPVVVKKEVKKVTTTANAVKLKADGTPDKRYTANKAKKAVAGPTKKDGTADMRYKANKEAASKAPVKKN